jgi:hypothetical protein
MMKAAIVSTLSLLALATLVQADNLQLVASVPYDELRPMMRRVPPDYDFTGIEIEIWADVESDCFDDSDDVVDGFLDWFERWDPDAFPLAVEIRCKPWKGEQSVVVVSQFTSRWQSPTYLWIFSANRDGSELDHMLVENGSVGRILIVDHRLEFTLDRGRATSVVVFSEYPERADRNGGWPEWLSTEVHLLGDGGRRVYLDVIAAYHHGGASSEKVLVVTRDRAAGEPVWLFRSVGSSVGTIASSKPIPKMHGATRSDRLQAEVDALRPVLEEVARIRAAEDTQVVFENSVLKTLMGVYNESSAESGLP